MPSVFRPQYYPVSTANSQKPATDTNTLPSDIIFYSDRPYFDVRIGATLQIYGLFKGTRALCWRLCIHLRHTVARELYNMEDSDSRVLEELMLDFASIGATTIDNTLNIMP